MSCLALPAVAQHLLRADLSCDEILRASFDFPAPSPAAYVFGFAATCAIESPFYLALARSAKTPAARALFALLLCNLATHPAIHFLFFEFATIDAWRTLRVVLSAEIFAAAAEILIARRVFRATWKSATLWIGLANLASWTFS